MKLAAAGALSCCIATSALAGSVTQPGETVGLAAGAPLPEGLYFVNTGDWGNRSGVDTSVGVDIPVLAWSTPWMILGGRVQFLIAGPVVEVGVHPYAICAASTIRSSRANWRGIWETIGASATCSVPIWVLKVKSHGVRPRSINGSPSVTPAIA